MITAEQIIAAARDQIGTPFRHQGRLPGIALDCAGLIIHVVQMLGMEHFDQTGYSRLPSNGMLEEALDQQPALELVHDMAPGDVLLMRFKSEPQHLGIFTGDNLIHAYQPIGKVCEHRLDDEWRCRVVRVYRFSGVFHG